MPGVQLFRIGWAILGLLVHALGERLGWGRAKPSLPERLRAALERLGPTFVKLGQALSLRRDLLPESYIVALRDLQDHVAPFPSEEAQGEIERGLGTSMAVLFAEFDAAPMAAASIAQVHRARLHDGRTVVVKVRRPGIRPRIDRDMRTLVALLRAVLVVSSDIRNWVLPHFRCSFSHR